MNISVHSTAVEQVRAAYRQFSSEFQKGDANGVMALFARSDSVFVFDVGPPREHVGWNAYLRDLQGFFEKLELPIEHTVHDLDVAVSGDVAYTHSLQEVRGRFKNGKLYHAVVRVTDVLRRIDGRWLFVQESDPVELAEVLRSKELLLLLDQCEHVVDACANVAGAISAASKMRILATSREPLGTQGECIVRLPPLTVDEAASLFIDRTGTSDVAGNRDAVEAIAAKLDGLPMAIELAAARGADLTPAQLLETLSESLPGGQALRALFEWSYKLLTPTEQAVLRRLSVFAGGWTLDAAVALCADGSIPSAAVGDALDSLSTKSLVLREERYGAVRFRFLETTRQYAHYALERYGEDRAITLRHLQWATANAWELTMRKRELPYADWMRLQTAEFANYAAALREAFGELDDSAAAATILRSLSGVLESRAFAEFVDALRLRLQSGRLTDAQSAAFWLALAETTYARQPGESLDAARSAADLFRRGSDDVGEGYALRQIAAAELRASGAIERETLTRIEHVVRAVRESGDRHLIAGLQRHRARANAESGRDEAARAALRAAAAVVDSSDTVMLAAVIGSTAEEELRGGNVGGAIALWNQAASLVEELRPSYAALCFINIGIGETMRGNLTAARSMLARGLNRAQTARHSFAIGRAFDGFARLMKEDGNLERAARIAGFAAASFAGTPLGVANRRLFDELLRELRRKLGPGAFDSEYTLGQSLDLEKAVAEVA